MFIRVMVLPLIAALCAMGSGVPSVQAQETDASSADPSQRDLPVEITADRLEYLKEEERYEAEGSVSVTQGEVNLKADRVTLDNRSGRALARGRVSLLEGEDILTSENLEFNFRSKTGEAVPGRLFIKDEHLDLRATRLLKKSELKYELTDWWISACRTRPGKTPLWHLKGRRARAEIGGYLVARDVTFYIKQVPVFYTPFLFFPVKTERQSGLLIPRVGYSSRDGFRFSQPLFWAISPSQDATLTVDYRSIRGIGGELEYRYKLSRSSEGELSYSVFNDRITEDLRSELVYHHTERFSRDFMARVAVHYISDIDQFRDLNDSTAERVQESISSSFYIFRRWDSQELYLLARVTKNLQIETDTTLQRLPELGYRLFDYRIGSLPLFAGVEASAVHFWRDEEIEASGLVRAYRLDFFPHLSSSIPILGFEIIPRAGFRETWYSRRVDSKESTSRALGVYQVRAISRMVRVFRPSEQTRLFHHVQPAFQYDYVPFKDQVRLPRFDAVDELPRKNRVTYSLTNRLVLNREADPATGRENQKQAPKTTRRELIYWKISQGYDLHSRRIRDEGGVSRPFSNIRSESILRPGNRWTIDLDAFYNLYRDETVSFNSNLVFNAFSFLRLSAGQRYSRPEALLPRGDIFNVLDPDEEDFWFSRSSPMIRFLTAQTRLILPRGLSLTNAAYYDVETRNFAEILYGIEYNGDCWAFAASYQDLPEKNQFTFMITLLPPRLGGMAERLDR